MNSSVNLFTVLFFVLCACSSLVQADDNESLEHEQGKEGTERFPVCIVGGGLSGLSIASQLQKKGEAVHVFEREGGVGGKLKTFRIIEGGTVKVQVDMGAVLVIKSNTRLNALISKYNLTPFSHNITCLGRYDQSSGAIYPAPCIPPQLSETAISAAIASYATYRSQYFNSANNIFGFVNAPADLFVSIDEWLDKRNLTVLKHVFLGFTISGFGLLLDIPAIYMLYTVDAKYLADLFDPETGILGVLEGIGRIPEGMKRDLELGPWFTLSLNSPVTSISRDHGQGQGQGYQVLKVMDKMTVKCSKTILAFPPLLSYLQNIITDLTAAEKTVLAEVKINKFMSTASYLVLNIAALVAQQQQHEIKGQGEVVSLARQPVGDLPNVFSSYSWIRGDFDQLPNFKDTVQMGVLRELFFRNVSSESLSFIQDTTDYFPHVSASSMRNGFYNKFNALQGNGGLYYASTLLGFETMETALRMSEEFTETFFK